MQGLAHDVGTTVTPAADDDALLQRLRDRDAEMRVLSQRLSLLLTVPDRVKEAVAGPKCAKYERRPGPLDTAAQDRSREVLATRLEQLYSSRQQVNGGNGCNVFVQTSALGRMSCFLQVAAECRSSL